MKIALEIGYILVSGGMLSVAMNLHGMHGFPQTILCCLAVAAQRPWRVERVKRSLRNTMQMALNDGETIDRLEADVAELKRLETDGK